MLLFISLEAFSQQDRLYATVDIVSVNTIYEKEAMFFYEKNWKTFRAEGLKMKFINGYKMIKSAPDSTGWFMLTLITEYADSTLWSKAEENFRPIMRKISPNGPQMLNAVKREEFLKYITGSEGALIYADERRKR